MNMQRNVKAMATGLGLISTLLISGMATAQEFSVPHNFVAGERAQAAQVNQNFTATAGAINESAAALSAAVQRITALEQAVAALQASLPVPSFGGVPVYSEGQFIGNYLDSGDEARFLSPKGYVFHATMVDYDPSYLATYSLEEWLRSQQTVYFTDASCMGDAYLEPDLDGPFFSWEAEHGSVFRISRPAGVPSVFYVPRSADGVLQSYNSVQQGSSCSLEAGEKILWPALPNDATVTGVPDAAYAKPFSLGLP
jgi:hypothetical protein